MKVTGYRYAGARVRVLVGEPLTTRVYDVELDPAESTASVLSATELVGKVRMRVILTEEEREEVARFAAHDPSVQAYMKERAR